MTLTGKEIDIRYYVFLFISVLPCCKSLQVSIPEEQYEVARGEDITLTCTFNPAGTISDIFILTWEAYPDNPGEPLVRG